MVEIGDIICSSRPISRIKDLKQYGILFFTVQSRTTASVYRVVTYPDIGLHPSAFNWALNNDSWRKATKAELLIYG